MGPHPAVAQVRTAVRCCLGDLDPGSLVLAACSGGPDSLALAAALAFVAPRLALRAGAVTVDHQLQPGSARQAARVAAQLAELGLEPVHQVTADVVRGGGPEAAARAARYAAISRVRDQSGAAAVLLGHTRDDQAETVLLGLARGSGGRSLAGMPERAGFRRRPLLAVSRQTTLSACAALGLKPWHDPQNADESLARVRVRLRALPALEAALGPGVAAALARSASQLQADADLLDELAGQAAARLWADRAAGDTGRGAGLAMSAPAAAALPLALRTRVLRRAAVSAGCPPGSLAAAHVTALDELLTRWHGQRWVDLPGGIRAVREHGKLRFSAAGSTRATPPARHAEDADGRDRHGGGSAAGADQPGAAAVQGQGARRPD